MIHCLKAEMQPVTNSDSGSQPAFILQSGLHTEMVGQDGV